MRRLVLVGVVAWLGLRGVARADGPSEADTQAAKIHYQAGAQYYQRAQYPEAIAEFKEAYRLSQAAALLYNMSQAYDRQGDAPHAREYLQRYIDSGQADPSELAALRDKVKSLDKRIADDKAAEDAKKKNTVPRVAPKAPAPAPAPVPVPVNLQQPAPKPVIETEGPRPWKTWKWVAAGAGAGTLIIAALFAADAAKMAKNLEDASKTQPTYTNDLPDDYARGQRDEKLAIGFGIAGAALAATGVVLFILDARSGSEKIPQARVTPIIAPGTAGASAVWRF